MGPSGGDLLETKSRETWLKETDRNMGFFHRTANAHRRRNYIKSISINGRKLKKEAEIKDGLVAAFQKFFSALGGWSPSLLDLEIDELKSHPFLVHFSDLFLSKKTDLCAEILNN